ncbi:MAG: molybdate ABC transporter substrate-binding protein [Saprospirales bacterium]|nr:molybdate ABC transporter substrate-binding protein [Saprospirales bacterium]MBK8489513.1 molybdate ABC transporter substrate-binding protein [Saprospirales bacterium]
MGKFPLIGLLFLILFGLGCQPKGKPASSETLTLAVAANVQFAMKELKAQFERETGISVETVLSSSGKLAAQIGQGAPYDVFISADRKYPEYLYREGKAIAEPSTYAYGILVLWTMKDLDISQGPAVLSDPSIQKIGIPNPQTAPYGVQAMRVLEYYDLLGAVESKLVYGESIAQANQYILSGVCEIGFTAKSVVLSAELEGKGKWVELDKRAYDPIAQGVVITTHGHSTHPEASRRFFDFLFSPQGEAIFEKFGYEIEKHE